MMERGKHYFSRKSGVVVLCTKDSGDDRIFSGKVVVGSDIAMVGTESDTWLVSRFEEVKEEDLEERKGVNQLKDLGF